MNSVHNVKKEAGSVLIGLPSSVLHPCILIEFLNFPLHPIVVLEKIRIQVPTLTPFLITWVSRRILTFGSRLRA